MDAACVQSAANIFNMQTIYAENEAIMADSLLKVKFNAVFKTQTWSQLSQFLALPLSSLIPLYSKFYGKTVCVL